MSSDNDILKYGEDAIKSLKGVNKWVKIVMAVLLGLGTWAVLPTLATMAENFFQFTINMSAGLAVGIATFVGLNFLWVNRFLLRKMRERISRKWWQSFVWKDPVDYLKSVSRDIISKRDKIRAIATKLRTTLGKLRALANNLEGRSQTGMQQADAWDKEGNEEKAELMAYIAVTSKKGSEDMERGCFEMEQNIALMDEFGDRLDSQAEALNWDIELMSMNLEAATLQGEAAEVVQSAMDNNSAEAAMTLFAKQAYMHKVAAGKARLDQALTHLKPILESGRIERAISSKQGREAMEAFRKDKDFGGLKSFRQELERLKREQSQRFGRKEYVDLDRFKGRNPETIRRSSGSNLGSFSHLD